MKIKLPWNGFNGYLAGVRFENGTSVGNVPKRSLQLLKAQFGDKLRIEEDDENRNKRDTGTSKKVRQQSTKKTNRKRRKKSS